MAKIIIGTTNITTEPNPSAGEFILAIDTADNKLKKKNSSGTVTNLESGGGGYSVVNINNAASPYTVLGTEDVILVNSTAGPVQINLLAASSATKAVSICDAFGQSAINAITIHPAGSPGDTINNSFGNLLINTPNQALTLVSNGTIGYNII